jgi:hypothetical protein
MAIDQVTKDEVSERARQWIAKQEIPNECPGENCTAVNRWRLGHVGEMNSVLYDKELGRGIKDPNPPFRFVVPIECEWCGKPIRYYEE